METWLLVFAAIATCVAFLLASLALGYPWARFVRGAVVGAAFIVAVVAMEDRGVSRERLLLPAVSMLCGLGIATLWRLDAHVAAKQTLWLILGLTGTIATYRLLRNVNTLQRWTYWCGFLAVILIGVTMAWGTTVNGAKLWLRIDLGQMAGFRLPAIRFQPGEPAKVLIAIFLAGFLTPRAEQAGARDRMRVVWLPSLRGLLPLLGAAAVGVGMFVVQNDLGAALLVFGVFVAMAYVATGNLSYPLLGLAVFVAAAGGAYLAVPHAAQRMDMWLNPWGADDVQRSGYQITQGLFCLGSGGVFGTGLGFGFPDDLPTYTAETDMIFAAMGEELGLVGAIVVSVLFVILVFRSFRIAWSAPSTFGSLLASALSTVFAVQALTIIGGVLRLVPLTGITLPFVSYGGSSLVTNMLAVGLLLTISRRRYADGGRTTARPIGASGPHVARPGDRPAGARGRRGGLEKRNP
ncbi:MAG: FtsW/RodA/SpoVE family cell cycle protein [Armatimonadota bacterium]